MPKLVKNMKGYRRQVAQNMRKMGYSDTEIGQTLGVSRERIGQLIGRRGLTTKKKRI